MDHPGGASLSRVDPGGQKNHLLLMRGCRLGLLPRDVGIRSAVHGGYLLLLGFAGYHKILNFIAGETVTQSVPLQLLLG